MIDRYRNGLSRPEQVVYFVREVLGVPMWRLTAARETATVIDQFGYGHHVSQEYWKHAFLKQYGKFSRFLRHELCSDNLRYFGLKKGLAYLDAVRQKLQTITDSLTVFQA